MRLETGYRNVQYLLFNATDLTVCTPERALTTVLLPWATWPMVPMLIVACREITSGERGVSLATSRVDKS